MAKKQGGRQAPKTQQRDVVPIQRKGYQPSPESRPQQLEPPPSGTAIQPAPKPVSESGKSSAKDDGAS